MATGEKQTLRDMVLKKAKEQYGTEPEYLWSRYPSYAVLRQQANKKWYAIVMEVPRKKLGLMGDGLVPILNVKADPIMMGSFLSKEGILPGYHMNKSSWITVLLDGTLQMDEIDMLLEMSYQLTTSPKKGKKATHNTKWIVPANPKYYDIEKAIRESKDGTFTWKQSNDIWVGDTVYLYVAAPISAIKYKCKAVEVNMPYEYADHHLHIKQVMRLKLIAQYDQEPISLDLLKEYGVYAVRGPCSIPHTLIQKIESMYSC